MPHSATLSLLLLLLLLLEDDLKHIKLVVPNFVTSATLCYDVTAAAAATVVADGKLAPRYQQNDCT